MGDEALGLRLSDGMRTIIDFLVESTMRQVRLSGPTASRTQPSRTARPRRGSGRIEPLDPDRLTLPEPYRLLRPVDPPEVWCAGVTYERYRDARVEESAVQDVYTRVYDADRPELFLKDAGCRRTVGPGEPIGIRSDSSLERPRAGDRPRRRSRRRDRRRHDRQRRLVPGDRGREPALPAAGEGLCRRLFARAGRSRLPSTPGRSRSGCGSSPMTGQSSSRARRRRRA